MQCFNLEKGALLLSGVNLLTRRCFPPVKEKYLKMAIGGPYCCGSPQTCVGWRRRAGPLGPLRCLIVGSWTLLGIHAARGHCGTQIARGHIHRLHRLCRRRRGDQVKPGDLRHKFLFKRIVVRRLVGRLARVEFHGGLEFYRSRFWPCILDVCVFAHVRLYVVGNFVRFAIWRGVLSEDARVMTGNRRQRLRRSAVHAYQVRS